MEEAALVPGVESVGLQPLGAQPILGEVGEGALGEALQPGDALPADRAVERLSGGGVQAICGLGGGQCGAQPVKFPGQGGVVRRQRGQTRQRRGIVHGQRHPLGALGQPPRRPGHGALRRGAEHAGHAGVAGDAAARAETGEYAPDQRRQRAGVLGGVVHAAQRPADAEVVRSHLEGGFQVVAPQHGQLGVVGAQVGVGHAGHLLELGGVEQPVGVGPGPVRLAQDQKRPAPAVEHPVRGLDVHGVVGLGEGLDHRGLQRLRQRLPKLLCGQRRVAHQRGHLVQRAHDPVPHLGRLPGLLPKARPDQRVDAGLEPGGSLDVLQEVEQRRQLGLQIPGTLKPPLQGDEGPREALPHRLQRLQLGLAAPLQRPEQRPGADAVAGHVVGQAVRLVVADGHKARAQQRERVLDLGARLDQPERRKQALRQGVPRGGAAGGQEHRHAVGAEGVLQRLAVGVGVAAEDQKVVPAPVIAHGEPAAQRRGELALLHGVAGGGQLDVAGRPVGVGGQAGVGVQLPGQVGQLPGLPGDRYLQRVGDVLVPGDGDQLHRHARGLAGLAYAVQAAAQGVEHVGVPGVGVGVQGQEEPGLRARRRHRRHQPVQRGRGQVEAVEGHVGVLQKRRASRTLRRVPKLRFAVLEAARDERLVAGEYGGQVFELHGQQPVGRSRAVHEALRGQPRLPQQLQLPGAAVREAPSVLRAAVEAQPVRRLPDGRAGQHHPAPLVHPRALRHARGLEHPLAQPLRADHLQREGALQPEGVQQRPLGLERQLLRHHDDMVRPLTRHGLAQRAQHGALHEPAPSGVDAHVCLLDRFVSGNCSVLRQTETW